MTQEQLFASFILDKKQGLEIALQADCVAEATPITGKIRELPGSRDYIEGIMHLRDEPIPLINLKKRLGLKSYDYGVGAMIAVVNLYQRRYGLLFDDIKEVFAAGGADIQPMDRLLQSDDPIIAALVRSKQHGEMVELLDLNNLFGGGAEQADSLAASLRSVAIKSKEVRYRRYVIFRCSGQAYGMPVECTQEITFFDAGKHIYEDAAKIPPLSHSGSLDDIFKHGDIDGVLSLRGQRVPVLKTPRLLGFKCNKGAEHNYCEKNRILILNHGRCRVGLVVEEVTTIETIAEDRIMPLCHGQDGTVAGIYRQAEGQNILLLDALRLMGDRLADLQAMNRLAGEEISADSQKGTEQISSQHLLTENCYLIFSVGRIMAVQLKDVQEIIENADVMALPGGSGLTKNVINLRGRVVPVINLREFYGHPEATQESSEQRLIICRGESATLALEADSIVTIYKQEHAQKTTAGSRDLVQKQDTLDRLIVYDDGAARKEHVFVINIQNLVRNHLGAQAARVS